MGSVLALFEGSKRIHLSAGGRELRIGDTVRSLDTGELREVAD
jgi:hypothetical protein